MQCRGNLGCSPDGRIVAFGVVLLNIADGSGVGMAGMLPLLLFC